MATHHYFCSYAVANGFGRGCVEVSPDPVRSMDDIALMERELAAAARRAGHHAPQVTLLHYELLRSEETLTDA